jgi:hypothetical protein
VAQGNFSRIGIARVLFNKAGDPTGAERLGIALEPTRATGDCGGSSESGHGGRSAWDVMNVRFDEELLPIHSVLQTGDNGCIVIEVNEPTDSDIVPP